MIPQHPRTLIGCIAGLCLLLTACVTNTEGGTPDGWQASSITPDPEVQKLVPAAIAQRGAISIGSNPPFAPAEFKDSTGTIIGFDIDLATAAAQVMGLQLEVREQDFNLILPAVSAGSVDFGASGFTDTAERQKTYDFVNYLTAGIQWATQTGETVNPNDACGLTVAVQRGTVSDTDDITNRSRDCETAGKPPITKLAYESSDAAATALILGRADAFSADSPVTAYAVARSDGKLQLNDHISDAASYGWPVKKNSELQFALAAALNKLIETGEYQRIFHQWGVTDGLVTEAHINGQPITR